MQMYNASSNLDLKASIPPYKVEGIYVRIYTAQKTTTHGHHMLLWRAQVVDLDRYFVLQLLIIMSTGL